MTEGPTRPIAATERPLADSERRQLTGRLTDAAKGSRLALIKTGAASGLVCGVLAAATLWASNAPRVVVALFWTACGLVLTLWIGMPWRRLMRSQIPILEDALRAGRAREIRLQASRVVEFEEEEDEGACYAFEHGPDASAFVTGQEFYEDDDFPNDDFSIVEILGTNGRPVDVRIVKRGGKLTPERVIPASVKRRVELPEHLTVVPVPLDRVEDALPQARRA